jgi:competence protein ComEA
LPDNKPVRFAVLAVVAAMAAGLLWLGVVRYQAEQRTAALAALEAQPAASAPAPAQEPAPAPAAVAPPVEEPPPAPHVVVHVAGAVAKPGVYKLDEGARVADALLAAGGPLPEAMPDALNLADRLADGQKVYVMTKQELLSPTPPPAAAGAAAGPAPASGSTAAAKPAGKVSINTSSAAQLDQLPSVSPTVAQAIVDYRKQNGPFKSIDELDNVKGIGPATIEKIRPNVTL